MKPQAFARAGLQEIKQDQRHGASQLAHRCLQLVAEYARRLHDIEKSDGDALLEALENFVAALQAARPSMAPIENLLREFIESMQNAGPAADVAESAEQRAQYLIEQSKRAVFQTAEKAGSLVGRGDTIFTHSFSSTIAAIFQNLHSKSVKAVITESRPGNEGELLARQLSALKIPTQYITEAQISLFIRRSDIVLVGADTLLADGSVVNKTGTHLLAMAAFDAGVPFYVCCESYKQSSRTQMNIALEEKSNSELQLKNMPFIEARNIYFDITPRKWISGYISEQGIRRVSPVKNPEGP